MWSARSERELLRESWAGHSRRVLWERVSGDVWRVAGRIELSGSGHRDFLEMRHNLSRE